MFNYIFSIQYKTLFDNEWQFANESIKANAVNFAIKEVYNKYKNKKQAIKIYIASIYREVNNENNAD